MSDYDRQRTVAILRDNAARGVLSLEELEDRIAQTFKARTGRDLTAVTWDLPTSPPGPPRRRSVWQQAGFRYHAASYGFTNAFLIGTWALTGHGFFWPFFPAMGWGIGLGVHGVVAHHHATSEPPPRSHAIHQAPPAAQLVAPAPAIPTLTTSYVAVLFVDVANSTGLTEAMGDGEWRNVRARHLDLVRASVRDHQGREVSVQGDGLFVRFATPEAAAACAVDIQRRIRDRKAETGFAPSVRIGIHAGEAVEDDEDLLGSVINLAARVTAEAAPNQILCTESTADRLGRDFTLEDRGLRSLKGLPRPRHLLSVEW